MLIYTKEAGIPAAPTDETSIYPEEDGEPMAASDRHRRILMRTLDAFDEYFAKDPGTYVSGDILMYYVEGDPRKSISPDVLISYGLGKKLRRTYLVWQEGKVPDFVMEFSSKNTYRNDLGHKMELYALLGIPDYFLYDAEALYLPSPLMGFTLVDGTYVPVAEGASGGLHSPALALDFHVSDVGLGIYDPATEAWLQTPAESAMARAELEAERAEEATERAEEATERAELEAERAEEAAERAEEATERAELEAERAEEAAERADLEAERADLEAERAQTAEKRAQTAEAEAAQLRELLARLQANN